MSEVTYKKRSGFHVRGDTQKIGECLSKLTDKNGILEPKSVVENARNPNSPLHRNFEWDDTEAANQYRLVQARRIIGAFEICYESGGEELVHRAFISLDEINAPYTEARKVLTDKQQRAMWLAQALRELKTWKAKYQHIAELSTIYDVIDNYTISKP